MSMESTVAISMRNPPPRTCFTFFVHGEGLVAIVNQGTGVGVGPGSAGFSTGSTSRS